MTHARKSTSAIFVCLSLNKLYIFLKKMFCFPLIVDNRPTVVTSSLTYVKVKVNDSVLFLLLQLNTCNRLCVYSVLA